MCLTVGLVENFSSEQVQKIYRNLGQFLKLSFYLGQVLNYFLVLTIFKEIAMQLIMAENQNNEDDDDDDDGGSDSGDDDVDGDDDGGEGDLDGYVRL